jgi:LysM repeat protein|nr:penicillin-insensitive murein endopeptidase [Kofleriaceae bacterium]
MRSTAIVLVAASAVALTAHAERYVVQRGETLEHVAETHGCTTEVVLRANHRDNTLVPPGTVVIVPDCRRRSPTKPAPRHDVPSARDTGGSSGDASDDDEDKAREALATIDGATWVDHPSKVTEVADDEPSSESGDPWNGTLEHGEPLPQGDGYVVRRPNRAYGATHVIDRLQDVIAEVREVYPELHTLAIGDLSRRGGGRLPGHVSHQTGLDVDIGFYFTTVPAGYPDSFHAADDTLNDAATWALLDGFARTSSETTGVQMIFLDYDVQARLYKFAESHGVAHDELDRVFQYPRGKSEQAGIVRHWPHHADHMHVRFKPGR